MDVVRRIKLPPDINKVIPAKNRRRLTILLRLVVKAVNYIINFRILAATGKLNRIFQRVLFCDVNQQVAYVVHGKSMFH